MRGELRLSATERGGGEPESVIVCVERIPEPTALSVFAPVMTFIKSKNRMSGNLKYLINGAPIWLENAGLRVDG